MYPGLWEAVACPSPGRYLAVGDGRLPRWFLSELAAALGRGLHVTWVDAGNSFDAYGLSYAARAAGFDPKLVLSRVLVARPFNLFQLETMVCEKLPVLSGSTSLTTGGVEGLSPSAGYPIVLSDPLALLYDDDVPLEEAAGVFERVRAGMRALPALWLTLAVTRQAPKGREHWLDVLIKEADSCSFLIPSTPLSLRSRERTPHPDVRVRAVRA